MARREGGVRVMRWTEQEELELEYLAGDSPWGMVISKYNEWAVEQGFVVRSALSLERRIAILGGNRRTQGEWITIGMVSEILGIDREKPRRWVRQGKLRVYRESARRPSPHYVRRKTLRSWAQRDPAFFRCYPRDALVALFDDPGLADRVHAIPLVTARKRCRPLRCVETGEEYRSMGEAAAANFVSVSRMSSVINTRKRANGRHFVDVEPVYGA